MTTIFRRFILAAAVICAAAAATGGPPTAHAQAPAVHSFTPASSQGWFWSPGWCKSMLKKYGMRLYDGRTFNIEQANCIGVGGQQECAWNDSYTVRTYHKFTAAVRSYDGTTRTFTFKPTGRTGYEATKIKAHATMTFSDFSIYVSALARLGAQAQNELGCGPPL